MEPNQTTQKSNGALVGAIVIVIILIIGGIYLWKNSMENIPADNNTNTTTGANSTGSLDADINSIDLESLDNGL